MLFIAAILTILVGLMHSVLGGRYLISPILRLEGHPSILGSRENARVTLWAAWHATSLTWWGLAAVLNPPCSLPRNSHRRPFCGWSVPFLRSAVLQ